MEFADITSTVHQADHSFHETKNATYKVAYLGTDDKAFKAWRLVATFNKALKLPAKLPYQSLGDLIFSAWLEKGALRNVTNATAGHPVHLFILTRHDIHHKEIQRSLP